MYTKTHSSQSHNKPGLWTVHSIHCRILQHQLDTKSLRCTLQHAATTTKQYTENRRRLHQNNSYRPPTSRNQNTRDQKSHESKRCTILWQEYDRHFTSTTSHIVPTHQNIRNTSYTYYSRILDPIPASPSSTNNSTHIHNTQQTRSINGLSAQTASWVESYPKWITQ